MRTCRRRVATTATVLIAGALAPMRGAAQAAPPPAAQNPSPMVELTRRHERLAERTLAGTARRFAGPAGRPVDVHVPARGSRDETFDLVIHFHGASWLVHQSVAAANDRLVSAAVNLGAGSAAYGRPFADAAAFDSLLAAIAREVASVRGHATRPRRVALSGFSAGYGAVRAILREPRHAATVEAVLLLDGLHASYVPDGTVLAAGGTIDSTNLDAFATYARAAARGEKRFVITHSEIFPGTFASTTECTDWLLAALGVSRKPVLRWGPRGAQQLSEARSGRFEVLGFAGNSAPDHIDHLHAMPEFLTRILKR